MNDNIVFPVDKVFSGLWCTLYIVVGVYCTCVGVWYSKVMFEEFAKPSPKIPGFKPAHIFFSMFSLLRGITSIIWAILIAAHPTNVHVFCETIINGIPGYALTFAYCFVFFLWCSICMNLLLGDATGTYDKLRMGMAVVLGMLGMAMFVTLIIWIPSKGDIETTRLVEVVMAVVRDFLTSFFIFGFALRISCALRTRICDMHSDESHIVLMSFGISICLFLRGFSILVFYKLDDRHERWGTGSLINTMFAQLFCEVAPITIIAFGRKKTGLLSVYDPVA